MSVVIMFTVHSTAVSYFAAMYSNLFMTLAALLARNLNGSRADGYLSDCPFFIDGHIF